MCPPRICSHRRQFDSRVISEDLTRLREPDCRSVVVYGLVRLREILSLPAGVERVDGAVDVRVEGRAFVRSPVIPVGAGRSYAPGSAHCAGTWLGVPLTDDGIEGVFAGLVDYRRQRKLLDIDLHTSVPHLFLNQHRHFYA